MAFKTAERCGEYTLTTGTGTITTAGPPQQMQTLSTGIGTGNTFQYMMLSGNGTDWEQGIGTVTVSAGVTTVARTTVVASTNSNAAVSLVGTSFMFATDPANINLANGLLDSLFGTAQGTIIYRDASSWLGLGPGTSGQFLKTQGAAANPAWAAVGAGGSGGGLFNQTLSATPSASSTSLSSWYSQGAASVADSTVGVALTIDAAHAGLVGRTRTIPATPYTITALVTMYSVGQNGLVGIGWTDGTKVHIFSYGPGTGAGWQLTVGKWTNATTFSATDFTGASSSYAPPFWLRIHDDGTTIDFWDSADGVNFTRQFQVTRAIGFLGASGYTSLGFFARTTTTGASTNCGATLLSWAVT